MSIIFVGLRKFWVWLASHSNLKVDIYHPPYFPRTQFQYMASWAALSLAVTYLWYSHHHTNFTMHCNFYNYTKNKMTQDDAVTPMFQSVQAPKWNREYSVHWLFAISITGFFGHKSNLQFDHWFYLSRRSPSLLAWFWAHFHFCLVHFHFILLGFSASAFWQDLNIKYYGAIPPSIELADK